MPPCVTVGGFCFTNIVGEGLLDSDLFQECHKRQVECALRIPLYGGPLVYLRKFLLLLEQPDKHSRLIVSG